MEFTFQITEIYHELKSINRSMLRYDEDHALCQNGVGYNKGDSTKAHKLQNKILWREFDVVWLYNALRRYQRQLQRYHEIDWNNITNPTGMGDESSTTLQLDDLKQLEWDQGKQVNTKNGKMLVKRATNIPTDPVQNQLFWNGFWDLWKQHKKTIKWTLNLSPEYPNQWNGFTRTISKWVEIPEMKVISKIKKEIDLSKIKLYFSSYLLPYQPDHVKKLLYAFHNNNGKVLDGSDTGTGKTFCSIAMALELKKKIFVICPKSVIPSWIAAMKHFGISEDNINKEGADHFILNYGLLRIGKYIHMRYSTRTAYYRKHKLPKLMYDKVNCPFLTYTPGHKRKYENYEWNLPDDYLIIYDEVHRCKNRKTANTATIIAAKDAGCNILGMSATIAEDPMKLNGLGYVFGLYETIWDFYDWAREHGCDQTGYNGSWEFQGNPKFMKKIHNNIYYQNKRGARMAISDLKELFPETQITSEIYNMGANATKIQKAYDDMEKELKELSRRSASDYRACVLTLLLRARQKVELLKVPTFVEMIEDYVESGNSVAVFVNFNQTIDALVEKLNTKCVIRGGQNAEDRQYWIEQFQADKQRIILCNINAGGVGISLHDLHGKHPRVAIISPTFSAQDLLQAKGRIWRAGGMSIAIQRIIFCANTIEESICSSIKSKIHNLNLLNDGDLTKGLNIDPVQFKDYVQMKKEIRDDLENMDEMLENGKWIKKYSVKTSKELNIIL